ncbi:MAG: sporulation protein YqfC [Clostridia bacterium]|nr:MAG: sporulation protein YqfC [Clostridia bacterium]
MRRVESSLVELLDLPADVVFDLPRLTVIGNRRVVVQNHRGIVAYTPRQVRVGATGGEVEITGEELQLEAILSEEVVVRGRIARINLRLT